MSENNKSSLEKFFDIGKPQGLDGVDTLGWGALKDGVTDNLDRVQGVGIVVEQKGYETNYGDMQKFDCIYSHECGSNFTCVNGVCMSFEKASQGADTGGTSQGRSSSGGSQSNCRPITVPPLDPGCIQNNCLPPPGCGRRPDPDECLIKKPEDCCGEPMWICPFKKCPQCGECEKPYKACTSYCTVSFATNGRLPAECKNSDGESLACEECNQCVPTGVGDPGWMDGSGSYSDPHHCQKKKYSAPCYCYPDKFGRGQGNCPDCKTCARDGGTWHGRCVEREGLCIVECDCEVKCPCGPKLKGTFSKDRHKSGQGCKSQCRKELYKECETKCPPPKDPCKADPNNKCEKSCECKTYILNCDDNPYYDVPCPPGKRCEYTGHMSVGDGQGGCKEYDPATGLGGLIMFRRECVMDSSQPGCDECDCHCSNDCPDCFVCGSNGKCQPDPLCDVACTESETACEGSCCPPGSQCVPEVCVEFTDSCHGQYVKVCGPTGTKFGLQHIEDVSVNDAVCDRWHTHCWVTKDGVIAGSRHLDCQQGLPGPTPSGNFTCTTV